MRRAIRKGRHQTLMRSFLRIAALLSWILACALLWWRTPAASVGSFILGLAFDALSWYFAAHADKK